MFTGYVTVNIMGKEERMPPVKLNTVEEAWRYTRLQMRLFPEVIIVDDEDWTVIHAINGEIAFPVLTLPQHFTTQNEYECKDCGSRLIQDKKCLTCDSTNMKTL